jgi:ADP-ribose pyrophosphatase YjhB (NUDIX family)
MRQPKPKTKSDVVFETPWFQISSKQSPGSKHPHYSIHAPDFVVIVATTTPGHLLLVRQFRPSVGGATLELPSGHVDPGETPEQAARRELQEETGHDAKTLELLATLSPSTARFTNRLWCFFAKNARLCRDARLEPGVELVRYRNSLASLLNRKEFCSAASYGVLCVAMLRGKLKFRSARKR